MAQYRVVYVKAFEKELRQVPVATRQTIVRKILGLASDPRPQGAIKLRGSKDKYRFRQGDYRVIYSINDTQVVVLVLKVGHRRDVYAA